MGDNPSSHIIHYLLYLRLQLGKYAPVVRVRFRGPDRLPEEFLTANEEVKGLYVLRDNRTAAFPNNEAVKYAQGGTGRLADFKDLVHGPADYLEDG